MTKVITFRLAYLDRQVTLCPTCVERDDHDRGSLGPVIHGLHDGHCQGMRHGRVASIGIGWWSVPEEKNMMRNYTITCESGTVVLVRARTAEQAEEEWDAAVRAGIAEERINGTTSPATRADVRACVASGHDYR
jgi:hypothetical protein